MTLGSLVKNNKCRHCRHYFEVMKACRIGYKRLTGSNCPKFEYYGYDEDME